jgi:hypothetical protein
MLCENNRYKVFQSISITNLNIHFGVLYFQTTFIVRNVVCIQFKIYKGNVHCYQILKVKLHIPLDVCKDIHIYTHAYLNTINPKPLNPNSKTIYHKSK